MAQDPDDQPSFTYHLPMGDTTCVILKDINDHISSQLSGIQWKKVSNLLLYPGVHGRHYYHIEGEEVIYHRSLSLAITEVGGMKSYDLNKTDVVFLLQRIYRPLQGLCWK